MTMPYKPGYICLFTAFFYWILLTQPVEGAEKHEPVEKHEDTMLMFVGEKLEVLSIASRREESAWQAPAVAHVITGKELREQGADTVSDALEMVPGFYMAKKEWGTQPYLRGIPDSVLFLYDTIPVCSDIATKSVHSLDYELSLAPVKRIEIIRGPGSVLWGPDAFAGIVNIVPMSGKDIDGVETGLLYESPGYQKGFYVNMGRYTGNWDAFLSVSGRNGKEDDTLCNMVNFWESGIPGRPVPPDDRIGKERPGKSHYLEASGRFSYRNLVTVSARLSDNRKPYAISDNEGNLIWEEIRGTPSGLVKLEAKQTLNRSSALRITGSYNEIRPEYHIIDHTLEHKESIYFTEIIYDQSFLAGQGLFTGGISYREKRIQNAPIWESDLLGYLNQTSDIIDETVLPVITNMDYNTCLWSLFGQYTHKIGDIDLWFGVRNDAHDTYQDKTSFNAGANWSPSAQWIFKMLYGTAYRTSFARKFWEKKFSLPDLEQIKSLNLQVAWKPSKNAGLSICGFTSRIENHIMEDSYAKLSLPNKQDINGVEIEGNISPHEMLNFSAGLSMITNYGPEEKYRYKVPSTDTEERILDLNYPYDGGPDILFNLTGTWQPTENLTTFLRLSYAGPRQLIYFQSETEEFSTRTCSGVWQLDMNAIFRDIFLPGLDMELSVENLTDTRYETPGTYNTIEGNPFSVKAVFRKKW